METLVICPNKCSPSQLESEEGGGFRVWESYYPEEIRYHCGDCDWTAVWREGEGLQVLFPGVRRER